MTLSIILIMKFMLFASTFFLLFFFYTYPYTYIFFIVSVAKEMSERHSNLNSDVLPRS